MKPISKDFQAMVGMFLLFRGSLMSAGFSCPRQAEDLARSLDDGPFWSETYQEDDDAGFDSETLII